MVMHGSSITCPAGQTAVSNSWWARSQDGTPITLVIRDAIDRETQGNVRVACGNKITTSTYSRMSVAVICYKSSSQNCVIEHKIGFLCTPFPPINYKNCETTLDACPLTSPTSRSWYEFYNPQGGVNLMNQFCCQDGTDPVVDNGAASTCRCGPVVLTSSGYARSTYWIPPNTTNFWIDGPIVNGAGMTSRDDSYTMTISPSLTGTGLVVLNGKIGYSSNPNPLIPQSKTTYLVTMTHNYHTGAAPLRLPISIAIGVQSFAWVKFYTGMCSATCDGGTQSISYQCQDSAGDIMDNAKCSNLTTLPFSEICNTQTCQSDSNDASHMSMGLTMLWTLLLIGYSQT